MWFVLWKINEVEINMNQPPKKIKVHFTAHSMAWFHPCQEPCGFCTGEYDVVQRINHNYILLSEHQRVLDDLERMGRKSVANKAIKTYEKQLAEKDKMLEAMARKLPIPKNIKMIKMEKCFGCGKELVLHCPDDCP